MEKLSRTTQYGKPASHKPYRHLKYSRKPLQGASSRMGFKGFDKLSFLDKVGRAGTNPLTANLVSTFGILAIRPAITMADKKAPLKDRIYSACWQAGIALGGLTVMLPYGNKIGEFSGKLAEKMLGVNLDSAERKLIKESTHLADVALSTSGKNANRLKGPAVEQVLNLTDDQAEKLYRNLKKQLPKREKITAKGLIKSLDPTKVFRGTKKVNQFFQNPDLIREVRANRGTVNSLLENGAKRAKKVLLTSGTSKIVNFVLLMTALNGATLLVTRYLDPLMKLAGKAFNIKALKKGVKSADKEDCPANAIGEKKSPKKKWNAFDKAVFGGLGTLAVIEGANIAGNLLKKGKIVKSKNIKNIGYKTVGRLFKGIDKKLNISENVSKLAGKALKSAGRVTSKIKILNKKRTDVSIKERLSNQANVGDKWLERNVLFNLIARLGINVPTGQYYNATRDSVDQLMQLSLMGAADKTIVRPARKGIAKLFGVSDTNRGVRVIADQAVKNIFVVCTAMGFLNNAISSRALDFFKKIGITKSDEKEQEYKDFKKNFLYAKSVDKFENNVGAASISSSDNAAINKAIFSDFIKHYDKNV